jgi:hypothetical protein
MLFIIITSPMEHFIYPTNNFGHHNNTQYYYYSQEVTQGNNWNCYGLHQIEIRNESDHIVEVVGWEMREGRVEEDFKVREVRPGLFYSARLVPVTWGIYRAIVGAVTFKFKDTDQYFTLAFEDPSHELSKGYKGYIEEGKDVAHAISQLKDNLPKDLPWGSYEFKELDGRGKSVITIGRM